MTQYLPIFPASFFQSVATAKKLEADTFFGFKNDFDKFFVWAYIYGV